MTIGIVASGPDMLTLSKFLSTYDHDYIIYYDDLLRPYGDKPAALVQAMIADAIEVLTKRGVDTVILPPVRELAFRTQEKVLPLFQTYVTDYCFADSLVGKMWAIGDRSDIQVAQPLLESIAAEYTLSENQQKIQKFHKPMRRRLKETPLRKYFLTVLSYSDPMANKVAKFDLRYFKDANVDTLIPLNYGYFNYQNTISKFLNFKKCRFHKFDKVQQSFEKIVTKKGTQYWVSILYTGQKELLERQKKIMRTLQRWKSIEVQREKI